MDDGEIRYAPADGGRYCIPNHYTLAIGCLKDYLQSITLAVVFSWQNDFVEKFRLSEAEEVLISQLPAMAQHNGYYSNYNGHTATEHHIHSPTSSSIEAFPSANSNSPLHVSLHTLSSNGRTTSGSSSPSDCKHFVVAAIDFGTTYSGYAFSFTRDPDSIHMMRKWEGGDPGVSNQKTPTTLLLKPNGEFHSFGFGARDFYHDLEEVEAKKWYYFEKFKMSLHSNQVRNNVTHHTINSIILISGCPLNLSLTPISAGNRNRPNSFDQIFQY